MEYIDWNTKKIINPPYTVTYSGPSTTTEIREVVTGQDENGNDIIEEQYVDVVVNITEDIVLESYMFTESNNDYLKGYNIYPVEDEVYSKKLYDVQVDDYILNEDKVTRTFIKTEKPIDEVKNYIISIANADFVINSDAIAGADIDESSSWTLQNIEANNYVADNSAPTPLIDNMLVTRNKYTKDELVQKILQKASLYKESYGQLLGILQDRKDQIEQCNTMAELLALDLGLVY